jgi:sugar porter (SP) family MFS transporter
MHWYWSSIYLVVGVPALGDLLFGFDIGVTSFALIHWNDIGGLEPLWIGILTSGPATGALVTSFVVFSLADRIGRRTELQIAAGLFLCGGLLETFAGLLSSGDGQIGLVSLSLLLLGRWIYGSAIAFGLHGATTYVGEMVPTTIRGQIMSLNEVSVVTGILAGYTVGYGFSSNPSWAPLYLCSIPLSTLMLWLSVSFLPESPRWLALQGRQVEALEALRFILEDEAALEQHQLIIATQRSSQESSHVYEELCRHRPALIAGLGLVALLQLTGQPTVLTYASPILKEAGLPASSAVMVALFKIAMTFVAVFTVEHQGRKKLLFVGCCLMLVALVILSVAASTSGINHLWSTSVIMVAMFIYIGGYQIGFGTMIWLITIEVFPASIRGPAVALSVQTNFAMHALVEMLVPLLQARFGISVVFGIFGIISASAIAFVWLCIPETKGLSLEEVEDEFGRSSENHMQEELHLIDRHIPARVSAESSTMTLS